MRNRTATIPLYVVVIDRRGPDGKYYTGSFRGRYWIHGVSQDVFSYQDAITTRYRTGGRVALFREVPSDEVAEWARELRGEEPEPVVEKVKEKLPTYVDQLKALGEGDYEWLSFTKGSRSKKDVLDAYTHFVVHGGA